MVLPLDKLEPCARTLDMALPPICSFLRIYWLPWDAVETFFLGTLSLKFVATDWFRMYRSRLTEVGHYLPASKFNSEYQMRKKMQALCVTVVNFLPFELFRGIYFLSSVFLKMECFQII